MINKVKKLKVVSMLLCTLGTSMFAQSFEQRVGYTTLTIGSWAAEIDGSLVNNQSRLDFADTLGYGGSNNITFFEVDMDNNSYTIPDVKITAALLKQSTTPTITSPIVIDGVNLNGPLNTDTKYSTISTLFYGYRQQENLRLSMGLNVKYIDFNEEVNEVASGGAKTKTTINEFVVLPYMGFKYHFNFMNAIFKTDLSTLSIGDVKIHDYSYALEYYLMRDMFISYGYKKEGFSAENGNDKIDYSLSGTMLSFNLKF